MHARVKKINVDIPVDLCPQLVEFENGNLNNVHDVSKRIKFNLQKPRFNESKERILTADSATLKYIGQQVELPCRYYIGVVDSDSGDMEIYNTNMFHMKPSITEENNKLSSTNGNEVQKTLAEKNDLLVEAFGTAKQKRAVSARKRNIVDKAEINTKIKKMADNIDLSIYSPEPDESPMCSIAPPINLQASTPDQLYSISDIISPEDEPALMEDAAEFMTADRETLEKWRSEEKYPEYVLDHLKRLPAEEDEKLLTVTRLRYLTYMVQFFKLTLASLRKKDCLPGVPSQIKDRLFSEFSLEKNKKRLIPKRFKDKILCYMLVLALLIDECVLDCSSLMRDLKLGPARISLHLKTVGCYVENKRVKESESESAKKSRTVTVASLRLPLPSSFLQRKETP
ncbi:DNA-directed RNA polymerase I subunit RPA49-like [Rhopilema esculentum]|uniref:DNA-directed RNA polymerase I subunit RPA49-like n=1 Tax=Rhopilema esculentum TaxID=499914 RepID=UPI0031D656A2